MAEHFRQNLLQLAPSRVSSEALPGEPPKPSSDTASRRKSHLHAHSNHHHRRSSRHHAKEIVQSAFPSQPPTSFGDLLKQAKESISSSPADSRRASVVVADGAAETDSQTDGGLEVPALRKPARPEDVKREQRRLKVREQELRSSLERLSDQSLKSSRRLDDTYYSLLERVAQCQQTIRHLQELSDLTNELHQNFESDTKELAEDIEGQFEGFGNFESQQRQVAALETRIKAGKEKADGLTARLEAARERVDARAKLEAELEIRNTRRMKIFWSIVGTITGLIVLSILFQQIKSIHPDAGHQAHLDFTWRDEIPNAPIPDIAKEALMSPPKSQLDVRIESPATKPTTDVAGDGLHAFDEL